MGSEGEEVAEAACVPNYGAEMAAQFAAAFSDCRRLIKARGPESVPILTHQRKFRDSESHKDFLTHFAS